MAQTTIEWTWRRVPASQLKPGTGPELLRRGGRFEDNDNVGSAAVVPGFTFNPWRGCVEVPDSPACDHCYAKKLAARNPKTLGTWGAGANRAIGTEDYWKLPLQWNAFAQSLGVELNVFALSLGDVWEDHPALLEHRARLLSVIAQTPWLQWLLLTKRPENWVAQTLAIFRKYRTSDNPEHKALCEMLRQWFTGHPPANVRIGCTVENQEQFDRRFPAMLKIPAVGYFLSAEPLLSAIDLTPLWPSGEGKRKKEKGKSDGGETSDSGPGTLDPGLGSRFQIITGGESGAGEKSRPSHPAWFESLADQAALLGVPFHFKQWGDWAPRSGRVMGSGTDYGKEDPGCTKWTCVRMDESGRDGRTDEPLVPGKLPPDMGHHAYMQRVGKARAGRLLRNREWNGELAVSNGLE